MSEDTIIQTAAVAVVPFPIPGATPDGISAKILNSDPTLGANISVLALAPGTTPERYLLFETYDGYAALTAHRHSLVFAEWRPQIAALETYRTLEEFDIIVG